MNSLFFVYLYFAYLIFANSEAGSRKLSITYNEGCDMLPECEAYNLAHVTAVGDSDTIHYIWSSIGGPSILLAVTDHSSELAINWKKLLIEADVSNSIVFKPKPMYSVAFALTKLIEYNDTDDTADVSKNKLTEITELSDIDWLDFNETIDYDKCYGTLKSYNQTSNETLLFKVRAYGDAGRDPLLPHQQYTENTTQFEFVIDQFPSHFVNSRYAVEILMVSDKQAEKHIKKSIDDEYTPAIFSIINLIAPPSSESSYGSYTQWKPVVYSDKTHSLSKSLQCHETKFTPYQDKLPSRSTIIAFFDLNDVKLSALNISFGTPKDKFYKNTNYTSWSATVGYGDPPNESLSQLIIIVISAGLGIPVLVCIGGGIYTCVRKWKINKAKKGMDSSRYPAISSVN